jgi:subtilisin family serine protease
MPALRRALLGALLVGLAAAPPSWAAGRSTVVTWHGKQIHQYDAQPAGHEGRGVTVAVLDGWIDRSHPDFEGRALQGADCTSGRCVPGAARDNCGSQHGTHVAGTVASSSFGVASQATMLPVRVLTDDGQGGCTGTPADVAAGIRWAVEHGAKVLNLSLGPDVPGLGTSSAIPIAVHDAAAAGAVVVFSAGNADLPVAQAYGNDALVVAATGPSGRLASYSQYGQGVSVAAPGGQPDSAGHCSQANCITSLYPGGQYAVAAGTSMAAPAVSGLAALLFAQSPGRSRQSVLDRITGTARPLAGAGAGLVDAAAALGVSTTPRPTGTRSTTQPVLPPPAPPSRTSRPVPPSRAAPTLTPTRTPAATATPAASTPVPTGSSSPGTGVALPPRSSPDRVPLPLALAAGALVALAGSALLRARLRP